MTEEEAKKKQLLAAYAWGRHSAAAPECFALDPDKLVALCALGVMPPKVGKGAGSTPATGSAGNGVSVGEQPAATCVATTTNTMSAGEKTARHTPGPFEVAPSDFGTHHVFSLGAGRRLLVARFARREDADLFCASPDLLAALKRMLNTGLNGGDNVRLAFIAAKQDALDAKELAEAEASEQAVNAARAAIASVEGQS